MSTPTDLTKPAHTPTPWSVASAFVGPMRVCGGDQLIAEVGHDVYVIAEANAEFIVRACNAHDELYEFARLDKQIEEFDCPHDAEARCKCGEVVRQMIVKANALREAALAKASGESR